MVGVGVASGASGGGRWASEASGGGASPSVARLPPVGLASSRRRRRIASRSYFSQFKGIGIEQTTKCHSLKVQRLSGMKEL